MAQDRPGRNGTHTAASEDDSWTKTGEQPSATKANVGPPYETTFDNRSADHSRHRTMNVLALTIFVGFVLVTVFVLLWLVQASNRHSFTDREALLPLDDDATPCVAPTLNHGSRDDR